MSNGDWHTYAQQVEEKLVRGGIDSVSEKELLVFLAYRWDERTKVLEYLRPKVVLGTMGGVVTAVTIAVQLLSNLPSLIARFHV